MVSSSGKPFTVSELTKRIKDLIEGNVGNVTITGELSNVRPPSQNGHLYFTIKDANAQISAVMFAGNLRTMGFRPENGLKVEASGEVSVYAQRGVYQIVVRRMTRQGQGDLMAQFEELKRRLGAEGLFDQSRKRPLPYLPLHIGIVTAPTGAAIRDMVNVLTRRFPNLDILIAPAKVQGVGAAEEVAEGIRLLNAVGDPNGNVLPDRARREVIIVGRGGGSIEDLWSFNEEVVARAVAASAIPVVSGVGHEIDFTICDFAADHRAPTPSAAAEIVVREKTELVAAVASLADGLSRSMSERLAAARARLEAAASHRVFAKPRHAMETYCQRLDLIAARMSSVADGRIAECRRRLVAAEAALRLGRTRHLPELSQRLAALSERMSRALDKRISDRRGTVAELSRGLKALDPLAVLERGYTITTLDDGKALRSPDQAPSGTRLTTLLSGGKSVKSVVGASTAHRRGTRAPDQGQDELDLFGG